MKPPASAFRLALTVPPAAVDEQGHASNVAYLEWMNRAAIAHSRAVGFDLARYRAMGGWFVVRRHELDYLTPARAGDVLDLFTWISGVSRTTAERRHVIRRRGDEAEVARGLNLWVFVDLSGSRPRRIPDEVREALAPEFSSQEE